MFAPDLPTSCYCDQIFNPDKNFIQCKKCRELIHMDCFLSNETKRCFNGGCNNNIENQLNQSGTAAIASQHQDNKLLESKEYLMIGNKRKRDDETEEEKERLGLVLNISSNTVNTNVINLTSNSNKNPIEYNIEDKLGDAYPNLSENGRKYLKALIDKIDKKNNAVNKPLTTDEKSRRTIRDKIFNSMLYGIEEIKENEEWSKMKSAELNTGEISEALAVKISNNLSVAIESAVFLQNNEQINNNYKKKFRTIYSNLSDCRNHELRYAILNNDILPEELVKMQAEELAPSSVKNRRVERQNKYFKEQVLMKEETKIISKTHKGESILTVDKDPLITSDTFFNQQNITLLEKQPITNINSDKKENGNNSDRGSWNYSSDNEENVNNIKSPLIFSRENSNIIKANKEKINFHKASSFNDEINSSQLINNEIKNKNKKSIKFKNLSSEKLNFYNLLEEYKKENLLSKFNHKIGSNLKKYTQEELLMLREKI